MSTRIPNSQLVLPDHYIDDQSGVFQARSTATEVLIYSLGEKQKNDMPRIGLPFFSSAYLLVDQDASEYTLWNVPPEMQRSDVEVKQRLVPLGATCAQVDNGPAGSNKPPSRPGGEHHGLSQGAIAGIVVAAVAAIALLCAIAAFLVIRRRGTRSEANATHASSNASSTKHIYIPVGPQELYGTKGSATHNRNASTELPPYPGRKGDAGVQQYEMPARDAVYEMATPTPRVPSRKPRHA